MPVIVQKNDDGEKYALIGAGFGTYKAMRGAMLGDILSKHEEGETSLVALCGTDGKIVWADSSEVIVVSIDGRPLDELLGP